MIQVRSSGPGRARLAGLFMILVGFVAAANAQGVAMTSGFSGSWFDPDHSGQGFVVQVLERDEGPVALVYFFTYDVSGAPLWLFGINPIKGNAVDVVLREPILGDLGDVTSDPTPELVEWGTLRLSFDDCGAGTAQVVRNEKIQVRSGTLRLARLAGIAAKTCTGGRSDDVTPEEPAKGFQRFLSADGLFGVVDYEQRPGEATFSVSLKSAPDGRYGVLVNDEFVGDFEVEDSLGSLRLRSPEQTGEPLLTFNPIGSQISLSNGEGKVIVTQALPGRAVELQGGGAPPSFGSERVSAIARVDSDSVVFAGEVSSERVIAEAELLRRADVVTFRVEVSGAEATTYDVLIDGRVRGQLGVASAGGSRSYGVLDFRYPFAAGAEPLTFDPRGATIEIRQADSFISGIDGATTVEFALPRRGQPPRRPTVDPKRSMGK